MKYLLIVITCLIVTSCSSKISSKEDIATKYGNITSIKPTICTITTDKGYIIEAVVTDDGYHILSAKKTHVSR